MKAKKVRDLKKVVKREKTFSTEAKSEGKGAAERAKKEAKEGYQESAKDSLREKKIDNDFSKIRSGIAQGEEKKLRKTK